MSTKFQKKYFKRDSNDQPILQLLRTGSKVASASRAHMTLDPSSRQRVTTKAIVQGYLNPVSYFMTLQENALNIWIYKISNMLHEHP